MPSSTADPSREESRDAGSSPDGAPSGLRLIVAERPLSYEEGLRWQDRFVRELADGTGPETLLLLEHLPVYTIGKRRDQTSLNDPSLLPHPVHVTNRGGQATYHGPGQLVGYPILDLNRRGRDLHAHLRSLEEILIRASSALGVRADRRDGLTGVWTATGKLASLGVGVSRWITMHGFALNVTRESLPPFLAITPCGIDGVVMTCLESEAQRGISVAEACDEVGRAAEAILAGSPA